MHIQLQERTLEISRDGRCIRVRDHRGAELQEPPIGWRCEGVVIGQAGKTASSRRALGWDLLLDPEKDPAYARDSKNAACFLVKLVDDQEGGTNEAICFGPIERVYIRAYIEDARDTLPDGAARSGTHLIAVGDTAANDSGGSTGTDGSS